MVISEPKKTLFLLLYFFLTFLGLLLLLLSFLKKQQVKKLSKESELSHSGFSSAYIIRKFEKRGSLTNISPRVVVQVESCL